jgi:predicted GNAT family N-acyltransferase
VIWRRNNCDRSGQLRVGEAPVEKIIDLRHRVLRQGLPRESAHFEGDDEPTTRHFAALSSREDVIGCATVVFNSWEGQPAWQLRGMAVDANFRGAGVGRRLLDAVEAHVSRSSAPLLWCNARIGATEFYQRLNWVVVSEQFEIPTAGPHVRMMKRLWAAQATLRPITRPQGRPRQHIRHIPVKRRTGCVDLSSGCRQTSEPAQNRNVFMQRCVRQKKPLVCGEWEVLFFNQGECYEHCFTS